MGNQTTWDTKPRRQLWNTSNGIFSVCFTVAQFVYLMNGCRKYITSVADVLKKKISVAPTTSKCYSVPSENHPSINEDHVRCKQNTS